MYLKLIFSPSSCHRPCHPSQDSFKVMGKSHHLLLQELSSDKTPFTLSLGVLSCLERVLSEKKTELTYLLIVHFPICEDCLLILCLS